MISRYSLPEMAAIWSEERKLELWQQVEALVGDALSEHGIAPPGVGDAIRAARPPTPAEVSAREHVTSHDVAAFVDLLAEQSGEAAPWVHFGLTSSDLIDTAGAVLMGNDPPLW